MRKASVGIFLGAVIFGLLAALALHRVAKVGEQLERAAAAEQKPREPGLAEMKKEILEAGDLIELHNLIYEKVGEERWESEVKPAFLRDVAARVMFDQGTPVPTPEEVKAWMRDHRAEVRELLEDAAR